MKDLTPAEGRELFDEAARFYLDMPGDRFVEMWDAGEFKDPDDPDIVDLVMLLPFVR